ncbi:unnamed protein product, partial [Nesidiocoris tenuis]
WIPGHIDLKGHDAADRLAGLTARHGRQTTRFELDYPDAKQIVQKRADNLNKSAIERMTESHGKWTRELQKRHPGISQWFGSAHISYQKAAIINRLILGHGRTPKFEYTIGKRNTPNCDRCGYPEADVEHLLNHCTALDTQRSTLLRALRVDDFQEAIACSLRLADFEEILKFTKNITI